MSLVQCSSAEQSVRPPKMLVKEMKLVWVAVLALAALAVPLGHTLADDVDRDVGGAADAAAADAGLVDTQVRYAMARLKLAELDLQRAVALNQPLANAIGGLEITRLTNHVRLMQRQVEIAQGKPQSTARDVGLAAAELAYETAVADLDAARAANSRTPGAIKEINIKRLEAKRKIAEIRVELYRNPSYVPSQIDEMQWHIDQLTEQLIDLRHRVETRSTNDFGNNE
jgi:hypothetical protein